MAATHFVVSSYPIELLFKNNRAFTGTEGNTAASDVLWEDQQSCYPVCLPSSGKPQPVIAISRWRENREAAVPQSNIICTFVAIDGGFVFSYLYIPLKGQFITAKLYIQLSVEMSSSINCSGSDNDLRVCQSPPPPPPQYGTKPKQKKKKKVRAWTPNMHALKFDKFQCEHREWVF